MEFLMAKCTKTATNCYRSEILTVCYELITTITEKNNMREAI